jgi:hypothetical protein
VRFGTGFDWVRGGKLSGLCSGKCPTGCKTAVASDGFSLRNMWTECVSGTDLPASLPRSKLESYLDLMAFEKLSGFRASFEIWQAQ